MKNLTKNYEKKRLKIVYKEKLGFGSKMVILERNQTYTKFEKL